ncbi:MAG: PilZ domain-containing protein [Phycisphaerae bacterium]|nr:PilZ domain-containing protein [Phycisphaerae bacterium]
MEPENNKIALSNEEFGFNVLQDIERQTDNNIKQKRSSERISVRAKIILQPANSSEFMSIKIQGVSGDISSGGCSAMFPIPVKVGDIYRMQFDKSELDISMIFGRCMRCKLVSEDAFESGFAFFSPIKLPDEISSEAECNKSLI